MPPPVGLPTEEFLIPSWNLKNGHHSRAGWCWSLTVTPLAGKARNEIILRDVQLGGRESGVNLLDDRGEKARVAIKRVAVGWWKIIPRSSFL